MTRLEANLQILENLKVFFENNPDIRFFQGLQVLKLQKLNSIGSRELSWIGDNFHEESTKTLEKLNGNN